MMASGAGGTEMYGQQAITGWTSDKLTTNTKVENRTDGTDARAAGIFAYVDEADDPTTTPGLGGAFYAPYKTEEHAGPGLGLVGVWGAKVQYTQPVTLPRRRIRHLYPYRKHGGKWNDYQLQWLYRR